MKYGLRTSLSLLTERTPTTFFRPDCTDKITSPKSLFAKGRNCCNPSPSVCCNSANNSLFSIPIALCPSREPNASRSITALVAIRKLFNGSIPARRVADSISAVSTDRESRTLDSSWFTDKAASTLAIASFLSESSSSFFASSFCCDCLSSLLSCSLLALLRNATNTYCVAKASSKSTAARLTSEIAKAGRVWQARRIRVGSDLGRAVIGRPSSKRPRSSANACALW